MLCLKAEALRGDMFASHGVVLPSNLERSIQRAMETVGKLDPCSPSSSGDGNASRFALEDFKGNGGGGKESKQMGRMCHYRNQLEQEVENLQRQLQQETDLNAVLADAVGKAAPSLANPPVQLPDEAHMLLANVAALEDEVLNLEEELAAMQYRLSRNRIERCVVESSPGFFPALSPVSPLSSHPRCTGGGPPETYLHPNYVCCCRHPISIASPASSYSYPWVKIVPPSTLAGVLEEKIVKVSVKGSDAMDSEKSLLMNLSNHPNMLSEEMVRCMRNIFLCLSESLTTSSGVLSVECLSSPCSSPAGHLSPNPSLASNSDYSVMTSSLRSRSAGLHHNFELPVQEKSIDPYRTSEKLTWKNIGSYSSVVEVSWMSAGKTQLEYAAEALKGFRCLVEQLTKANPARLNCSERLAFWINLYNALIMHAYLAYGVPKNDMKLFSLMQKVSYIVGGQSFSAAEIEYVVLKMKPPAHRPQMALILALHKFRMTEEHRKYSIENAEPLAAFALSCGMYSSPAVRVFTAANIREQLQDSMRDYVQASVGIGNKGKLLVPKLVSCYAKSKVEDSLLVDWICRHLTPDQVSAVRDSASQQRKQRFLGVRSIAIVPFDTRFRYLFLPDTKGSGYI